jgi:multidrug efflux system outer membrane protein
MRLEEAKAILRENRQSFLPSGGPAFGYESFKRSDAETPAGQARHIETYRASVDASWEIDLFGRVRRSVEAAQAQAGSREALLREVQASVAAAVAATWFELRGLDVERAVVDDISKSQRESLHMVERLVSAGSAHEFDRLRAEALLRNVEATAPDLERRHAAASNALAVLLGESPQGFRLPVAPPEAQTLAIRTIGVGDPAGLLVRRADIVAAERNLAAATAQIGVETAGLYPEVHVRGSLGLVAGSLDALNDAGAPSNFIGPVMRWSLLDRGRVRARIAASEARSQQALLLYDQTLLRALQETDDAFKGFGAAGQTLALRLLESAANREAARLARERFAEGEGDYLDVLEAERSDFTSRRALVVARTNQRLAVVSIYKALGGGWEVCAQAQQDCSGAGDSENLSFVNPISARP